MCSSNFNSTDRGNVVKAMFVDIEGELTPYFGIVRYFTATTVVNNNSLPSICYMAEVQNEQTGPFMSFVWSGSTFLLGIRAYKVRVERMPSSTSTYNMCSTDISIFMYVRTVLFLTITKVRVGVSYL